MPFDTPPACFDASAVVDDSCPSGENLVPYVFVELGAGVRHFAPSQAAHSAARSVSPVTMPERASATDMTYDERVGVGLPLGLYAAWELVAIDAQPARVTEAQPVLFAFLTAGFQQRVGTLSLAAELAGGVLAYSEGYDAAAEARVRADVWVLPWCTVGGLVGTSLIRRDEWVAGIEVGIHTHSYGTR